MPAPSVAFINPVAPITAGVPQLLNQIIVGIPSFVFGAGISPLSGAFQQKWGLFAQGSSTPLLQADSVGSIEFAQDYRISDYPQEKGGFESYNKVQVPFQAKIEFLLNVDREPFLQAIGTKLASLDFVTVVTPEISYQSANLIHYGYRRTARNGVTLVVVDVWVEEVRVTGTTQLSNTQSANGTDPVNDGTQQPVPTSTQQNLVTGLPNPTGQLPTTATLTSPNIPSAFVDSSGLPIVPNEVANLSSAQHANWFSLNQTLGIPTSAAYPPDVNNNVTVDNVVPF